MKKYTIALTLLFVMSCGNIQNKPVEVKVDPVKVYHEVSVNTDKLEKLYEERCRNKLDSLDYSTNEEYQLAVKECTNDYVTDFLNVFSQIK